MNLKTERQASVNFAPKLNMPIPGITSQLTKR